MRYFRSIIVVVILLGSILLPVGVLAADRQASIIANCSSIKLYLTQTQKVDLVSRTNRGRAYEALLRQVDAFSSRVRNNTLDATQTNKLSGDLQRSVNEFRSAYLRYDSAMDDLRSANCTDQHNISDFIIKLDKASGLRKDVGGEIKEISGYIKAYRKAVLDIKNDLENL